MHAHIRAALYNTVKSGLIHLGLINNHHHVGHMQGVCFFNRGVERATRARAGLQTLENNFFQVRDQRGAHRCVSR